MFIRGEELKIFTDWKIPRKTIDEVPVVEIFSAFQGEGALVGKPTIFLRLGGCDYHCSWCDSLYAVEPKNRNTWVRMLPDEVVRACDAANPRIRHITLTGGNPAIHKLFRPFLDALVSAGYSIAIETQGTIFPEWADMIDHVTLSPKPPSSGNTTGATNQHLRKWVDLKAIKMGPAGFEEPTYIFYDNVCLKIVVFDEIDLNYAAEIHTAYPDVDLYIQPGTDQTVPVVGGGELMQRARVREQVASSTIKLEESIQKDTRFDLARVFVIPQVHTMLRGLGRGF